MMTIDPSQWLSKEQLEGNAEACRTLRRTFIKTAAAYKALNLMGLAMAALVVSDDIDVYLKEITKHVQAISDDSNDDDDE